MSYRSRGFRRDNSYDRSGDGGSNYYGKGRYFNKQDDNKVYGNKWGNRLGGRNEERGEYSNSFQDRSRGGGRGRGGGGRGGGRGRGGRGRHPPGLSGREIGLWYAARSGNTGTKRAEMMDNFPTLSMDTQTAHAVGIQVGKNTGNVKLEIKNKPDTSNRLSFNKDFVGNIKVENLDDVKMNACDIKMETSNDDLVKQPDSFDDPEAFIASSASKQSVKRKRSSVFERLSKANEGAFMNAYRNNVAANQMKDGESSGVKPEEIIELNRCPRLDEEYLEELKDKVNNDSYNKMLAGRKRLPSYQMRNEILSQVNESQVVVLSGETGCGKTTQVPQFILDDFIEKNEGSTCRILCTQPRRISAISIAQRVAEERGERLGHSVGYQIRLDSVLPRTTGSVLYCTTGIVLQWLQGNSCLTGVSHLVLDEIHERDMISDFLICITRDLLPKRPDLKLILMSATLNAEMFSKYYHNCPMLHIPGFTFPVKEYYLEDVIQYTGFNFFAERGKPRWMKFRNKEDKADDFDDVIGPYIRDLQSKNKYSDFVLEQLSNRNSEELNMAFVLELLHHIRKQPMGSVLVFVPGWEQISKLNGLIENDGILSSRHFLTIPLHSLMPTVNQKQVFNRPPDGVRKIVIATNIAETSITIDDIVYVIDCGKIKMKNYDKETNISTLMPEWVTLANARQRKGRAGRVQDGICYHLYSRAREMVLDDYPLPEIQRTRLEEIILQVKILKLGKCKAFLSKVMEPPDTSVVDISIKMLETLNALDEDENLTPLGFHLARLPMDPLTGKMVLMGALFSCLGPILTVAASLSFKDPFNMVLGKEKLVDQRRCEMSGGHDSDHIMLVNAFDGWEDAKSQNYEGQYLRNNFLSKSVLMQLKNMRKQFLGHLYSSKFCPTTEPSAASINKNSHNIPLVKAIITAGLYPNVARVLLKKMKRGYAEQMHVQNDSNLMLKKGLIMQDVPRCKIHPKSVNEKKRLFNSPWIVYWEKVKTTGVYLYDTTIVSNYPLLLFGHKLIYNDQKGTIDVDDFVKIRCDRGVAEQLQKLRQQLDDVLEYKITNPGSLDFNSHSKEGKLMNLVVDLITNEANSYNDDRNEYNDYDNGEEDEDQW